MKLLPLSVCEKYVGLAKERGVSEVARSARGFMSAYRRGLSPEWRAKREAFLKRHLAQVIMRGEPLWESSGKYKGTPTRRHLALIMWAYSPTPSRLGRGPKRNPADADAVDGLFVNESDLKDAVQHADIIDEGWNVSDFDLRALGDRSVKQLQAMLDEGMEGWLEVDPGDIEELDSFRGPAWHERAKPWLNEGIPPVIVVTAPDCNAGVASTKHNYTVLGDGRGRVNFAVAYHLKLPVVHAVFNRRRAQRRSDNT